MCQPEHAMLMVEDSPEDYEITVRLLRRSGLVNPIHHCADGEDALDFLYRRGRYASEAEAPHPSLILLDLNLPGTDGREVLHTIKRDDRLKHIPVVILTTSADQRDIADCYQTGANSYICKPVGLEGLITATQRLKDYWFEIVLLPRERTES